MKKLIPTLLLLFIFAGIVTAQTNDIYYTRNASLKINGKFNGERLTGYTKDLGIRLDYETTDIIIRFKMNTIKFSADTLNNILKSDLTEVVFKGALSLDYINTDGHPPLDFTIEGIVDAGNVRNNIEGNGELQHVDDADDFACMLGMKIFLNLRDYNIEIPNLDDEVEIVIIQALLKKDKN
jgi:hypothetical protein